jgi:hypothetical protein
LRFSNNRNHARGTNTVNLISYVLAAIAALPTFHEDIGEQFTATKHAQAETIAAAIADAVDHVDDWPGSKRELATLLLTVAWHETGLSLRIHEGRCKPYECDHGRARGLWQLHVHSLLPRARWLGVAGLDFESTRTAAFEAARALVRSRHMCAAGVRTSAWVAPTLAAYAGRGCRGHLPDIDRRVQTYRFLVAIEPKQGAA